MIEDSMKKILHLEIEVCADCPYCGVSSRGEYTCLLKSFEGDDAVGRKKVAVIDKNPNVARLIIPEWCPLPYKIAAVM